LAAPSISDKQETRVSDSQLRYRLSDLHSPKLQRFVPPGPVDDFVLPKFGGLPFLLGYRAAIIVYVATDKDGGPEVCRKPNS
jgi:hypothetical protein